MVTLLSKRKFDMNKFMPEMDNETVFRRVVNRVYELTAFPRFRAITMDDFFQQMKLDINDFEQDSPKMFISDNERQYGEEVKKAICPKGEKLVGIHFFTGDGHRMIDPVFAKGVIDYLLKTGYKLAIVGTEKESNPKSFELTNMQLMAGFLRDIKDHPQVTYHCDSKGIRHKAAIIKNCDYFLCNDSGMMHIAWLYKVPTISLFRKQTVMDTERFDRPTGYWWACSTNQPFATYIIFDKDGKFDLELIPKRIQELDDARSGDSD